MATRVLSLPPTLEVTVTSGGSGVVTGTDREYDPVVVFRSIGPKFVTAKAGGVVGCLIKSLEVAMTVKILVPRL